MGFTSLHNYHSFWIKKLQYCSSGMVNILATIRIWGNQWMHQKVSIACDNKAVVQVLSSDKTRDLTLATIARNIQFQVAMYSLVLMVRQNPGKTNTIADLQGGPWSLNL